MQREKANSYNQSQGQLSALYAPSDPIVRRMLGSFDAALRYPGSELVYLYEL